MTILRPSAFILYCAVLLLSNPGFSQQNPATKKTSYNRSSFNPKKICENTSNSFVCARKVEKALKAIYKDLVVRTDDKTVSLSLSSGKKVILKDSFTSDDDSNTIRYSIVDYLERSDFYVAEIQYYEGSSIQIISRITGKKYNLPGKPVQSPSAKSFVCFTDDITGYNGPAILQVWILDKNVPVKKYELKPDNWGVTNATWKSESTILIERGRFDNNDFKTITLAPKELAASSGNWKLK